MITGTLKIYDKLQTMKLVHEKELSKGNLAALVNQAKQETLTWFDDVDFESDRQLVSHKVVIEIN